LAHFLGDTTSPFGFNNSDSETAETGHIFWTVTGTYAGAIFIVVPIDNIVAAIFNTPVAAVCFKNVLGVRLGRGTTGNPVGDFRALLTGFFIDGLPFDNKPLSNVGKMEIGVKFGRGPDFADFNSAMDFSPAF